jgi:heavy metal sensor kinase
VTRLRLRTRLTLWFAASILLILAPFLAGVLAVEWRLMREALDHHLEEDFEMAIEMLAWEGDGIRWRTDSMRDLGYDAGLQRWVEVYAPDGRLLFVRGVARNPAIQATLGPADQVTAGFRTVQTPAGARARILTADRGLGPGRIWVRVARTEDGLRQDFRNLVLLASLLTSLAIAVAALAGFVISGRMLSPLARMADRAGSISADRLSERLPVENETDELGRLAVVFNETFARLEASFERLKQFTADVSHELRTPLTAIRSVGEVGLREARDAAACRDAIASMLEEADRLARVVETLLVLSRWESGRVRPAVETVDLRALAEGVTGHLSVLAEERGIALDVTIDSPLPALADPIMVRQAVINVVDNAIKFTPEGGRVLISSESDAREHRLVIDDEGPGIPAALRTRLLDRFYRVEGTGAAGAGLGLAIVDRAMAANRGRIVIDTNQAGGVRVILSLPRAETSPA